MDPLNIFFGIVGIVSAIYGVYQGIESKKQKEIIRQNAWSLYHDASVIFGGLLRLNGKIQVNQAVVFELGHLTGLAEAMMNNEIRQININEKITIEKIDQWLKEGKLCHSTHRDIFIKFLK